MVEIEMNRPPKVFISYSWDNQNHEEWVLKLAATLRENGVDVILDKWELNRPGQLLPNFMERSIAESQRVICVMTPNYKKKTDQLTGGVGFEYSIITAELFSNIDTTKFIPLIRAGEDHDAIPVALRGRKYVDMRGSESTEELLRDIYKEPKYEKPPLGEKPAFTRPKRAVEIQPEEYLFRICLSIESPGPDLEPVCRTLSDNGWALQVPEDEKKRIYIGVDAVEQVYGTFIRVYGHLLYFDWKKYGIAFPPDIKVLVTDRDDRQRASWPDGLPGLNGFMTKDLYGQLSPKDKDSFLYLNDELFVFNPEEHYGHVLRDTNYYRRDIVLRRFSFLWLLADQLPTGSWGHSVAGWMHAVGKDLPGFAYNERIEEEGGFETTVLNMDLLTRLFSYDELTENKTWRRACKYLRERFDGSGFGPLESVGRTGIQVVSSTRHTALATCLFGKLIASEECTTSAFNSFFVKGVEKLFIRETEKREGKTMLIPDKRNTVLHYFLCLHIIREIRKEGKLKTLIENHLDIGLILKAWEQSKFHLEEQALADTYKANGSDSDTTTKLVVPYCHFSRMEVYSFLTSAFFLDSEMSRNIKLRYRKGVGFIVDHYLKEFGRVADRYSGDYLRPKMRGIKNVYDAEGRVDLGCTAMLLRVLRDDRIVEALWEGTPPTWLSRMVYCLNEDLLENFDRFIVCPESYRFTNAGMLANCLVGDDKSVLKKILNIPWNDADEDTAGNGNLSAASVSRYIEALQAGRDKAQVSTVSLRCLLLAKRPGRYVSGETGIQPELTEWPLSHKAKSVLTSLAYNESVSEFVNAHISAEREDTIRGIVSRMEKSLGGLTGKNILDAGCGLGDYAVGFCGRGASVMGIDISPEMIRNARNRNKKIDFRVMDMSDIPDEWEDSFDGIVCITAFQHIPIEVAVSLMGKFHRILRPGGVLRIDIQTGREQGFDPDLRYIESYRNRTDAVEKLHLEQIGFKPVGFAEWKLEKGKNSFRRYTEFEFVELWIQKL